MPKAKVTKVFSAKTRKLLSDAARRRWARERKLKAAAPVSVSTPPPPNPSILILRNDLVFETMRLHLRLEQFNAQLNDYTVEADATAAATCLKTDLEFSLDHVMAGQAQLTKLAASLGYVV